MSYEIPAWLTALVVFVSAIIIIPEYRQSKSLTLLLSGIPRMVLAFVYVAVATNIISLDERIVLIRWSITAWAASEIVVFAVPNVIKRRCKPPV